MGAAQYAIERMTPVLGVEITEPFSIVSYDNYRDMIAAVPFRAQAVGGERLITQGIAFTDERVLLVHHDASVEATTSHEFTHLLVAEATGHIQGDVPSWLNEGLAEYANIVEDRQYGAALQRGIQKGTIKPLWFLNTFSGSPEDIIVAYGQGTSVVYHMIDWEGEAKMAELMVALGETRDIDKALEQVYGFDVRGLDARWREDIGIAPLPTPDLERNGCPDAHADIPAAAGAANAVGQHKWGTCIHTRGGRDGYSGSNSHGHTGTGGRLGDGEPTRTGRVQECQNGLRSVTGGAGLGRSGDDDVDCGTSGCPMRPPVVAKA